MRSFEGRIKHALSLLGTDAGAISGGAMLANDLLSTRFFGVEEQQVQVAREVQVVNGQAVTNLIRVTNTVVRGLPPSTFLPTYRLSATITDATEEPVQIKGGRSWLNWLLGPLQAGTRLELGLNWRNSLSRVRVIVTLEDFLTHVTLADGEVQATLHKRERGKEFGVRYAGRGGAALELDSAVVESVEEALTVCTTEAFVIAFSRLAGLPLSMTAHRRSDEITRAYILAAWVQAPPERRAHSLRFAQALALERGLKFPAWPDPRTPATADVWLQIVEALPSPAGPFDSTSAKVAIREIRIVLEGFPYRRFQAIKPLMPGLILKADPGGIIAPDAFAPDCGWRFRSSRGSPDLGAMRDVLDGELKSLLGTPVDFHVHPSGRTIRIRYRSTMSPAVVQ